MIIAIAAALVGSVIGSTIGFIAGLSRKITVLSQENKRQIEGIIEEATMLGRLQERRSRLEDDEIQQQFVESQTEIKKVMDEISNAKYPWHSSL